VAYYPFNGNANDDSGNGNNGTPQNVVISTNRFGQAGHGYGFNGVNAYVSAPNQSYLSFPNGEFTISVWATVDGTSPNPMFLLGLDNGPGPQPKWMIPFGWIPDQLPDPSPSSYLSFHINNGDAYYLPLVEVNPALGSWHQFIFTKIGTTYTIYIDGVPASGTNYETVGNSEDAGVVGLSAIPSGITAPLTIGYAEGSGYFNGKLDDLRIYNRALSSSEVAQLYVIESAPIVSLLKAVKPSFNYLLPGTNYQLQVSSDLNTWTTNSTFTATNTSMTWQQYFDVDNWGQLFFRLQVAP
jgi:hypothetical protein